MSDRANKRLLLVASTTGYQTRVFADAARRLKLNLTLATDRCHILDDPWGDQAIPIRFEEPEASAKKMAAHGLDAIAAVGDRPALLAALAAELAGVPFHPPSAVSAACSKFGTRTRLAQAGLPAPSFYRVPVEEDPASAAAKAAYPCVLKPLALSASRGVIRADNPQQFLDAFARIRTILDTADIRRLADDADRWIQVETYIPGREFAVEALLDHGRLQLLAIFDKPDPLDGPFFEETLYITPSRAEPAVQTALVDSLRRAVDALGLRHGPVHAEMRHNEQGVWVLEAAPRPIGGLCARALRFLPDMPLEELILRHAIGEDVSAARLRHAASGVMMIPIPKPGVYSGVTGLEAARQVPGIEEVLITAKQGQTIQPLPEASSYLGFLFASAADPTQVEQALRQAHALLEFDIALKLPLAAAFE